MLHAFDNKKKMPDSRFRTAFLRGLPKVLIIGVEKSGTTSLARYLGKHPAVSKPFAKEARYFTMHFHKGISWYRCNFDYALPMRFKGLISYDASPMYLYDERVPQRIKDSKLKFKFIAILRNPIDRAYSHYQMDVRNGVVEKTISFEDVVNAELKNKGIKGVKFDYLARGYYAEQLKRWFKLFNREQFKIFENEELNQKPKKIYKEMLDFVGLKMPEDLPLFQKHNTHEYSSLNSKTRKRLAKHFEVKNKELFELLGVTYNW